ncbi:PTS system, IIA component [Sodalis praecaptivus]|uniref:PTS system, IIA component n=1 Tax=Sodalis praecaptivus TaxID=1239307 RepID=W0HYV4_9GAMM|nr:PTS sugar transporter subunit IIA [Sodalis praecaptivus]AHF77400.1 PTS system, IIA component [Sodalis praecaptivus]
MTTAVAINDVLQEECIILDADCQTKEQIISLLTDLLCRSGAITHKDVFLNDVYLREELGSTGFENHIAIPHGKSAAVAKTRIAVGRLRQNIPWETIDGTQVRLVILFAVKESDKNAGHIKMLAKISMALGDEEVVEKLLSVPRREEMYALLLAHSGA